MLVLDSACSGGVPLAEWIKALNSNVRDGGFESSCPVVLLSFRYLQSLGLDCAPVHCNSQK